MADGEACLRTLPCSRAVDDLRIRVRRERGVGVVFRQQWYDAESGSRIGGDKIAGAHVSEQMLTDTAVDPAAQAVAVSTRAFAKINLSLQVVGPRGDGYHAIRSLVAGVDLYDAVSATAYAGSFNVFCDDPDIHPVGNLAGRAARLLAESLGIDPNLHLDIRKRIPIGGGLGGGSSDAAAALRLCRQLWKPDLSNAVLAEVGAQIGSDVPLFFHLPSALLTGRGEVVSPVRLRWSGCALLILAGPSVSTPAVYAAWRRGSSKELDQDLEERVVRATSAQEIMALSRNDLESAIFSVSPRVADVFAELIRKGLGPIRVSGAGSVIYRLFDNVQEAESVAADIRERGLGTKTKVVSVPAGPAPVLFKESLDGNH